MVETLTLKCKNCGGNLEISPEMDTFACGFCGVNQMVERKGGTVALKLITDAISKVQIGTDKTAAELAIQRLKGEIEESNKKYSKILKKREDALKNIVGIYFVIFIFASIILLCSAFDSPYGFIHFIVWLAIGSCMGYVFYKHQTSINAQYKPVIEKVTSELKLLEKKMIEQKKIADN